MVCERTYEDAIRAGRRLAGSKGAHSAVRHVPKQNGQLPPARARRSEMVNIHLSRAICHMWPDRAGTPRRQTGTCIGQEQVCRACWTDCTLVA